MSLIYDFKSIAGNLRGDRWYTPAKPEPAKNLTATEVESRWLQARYEVDKHVESGAIVKCNWCKDIGFYTTPCFKCGKEFV